MAASFSKGEEAEKVRSVGGWLAGCLVGRSCLRESAIYSQAPEKILGRRLFAAPLTNRYEFFRFANRIASSSFIRGRQGHR